MSLPPPDDQNRSDPTAVIDVLRLLASAKLSGAATIIVTGAITQHSLLAATGVALVYILVVHVLEPVGKALGQAGATLIDRWTGALSSSDDSD